MKKSYLCKIAIAALLASAQATYAQTKKAQAPAVAVTTGVSHSLAVARAMAVSNIAYDLTFNIQAKNFV